MSIFEIKLVLTYCLRAGSGVRTMGKRLVNFSTIPRLVFIMLTQTL